jgi:hypothetical protein
MWRKLVTEDAEICLPGHAGRHWIVYIILPHNMFNHKVKEGSSQSVGIVHSQTQATEKVERKEIILYIFKPSKCGNLVFFFHDNIILLVIPDDLLSQSFFEFQIDPEQF